MHYCYILYSGSSDRYYIGETEDISRRLLEHNNHMFKNASTVIASDWEVYILFSLPDRTIARAMERYIKKMKSRKFIERFKEDENFKNSILKQFT